MKMVIFGNVSCHDSASVCLETREGDDRRFSTDARSRMGPRIFFFSKMLISEFYVEMRDFHENGHFW